MSMVCAPQSWKGRTMTDLSSVVATVAAASSVYRQHGNPHEQGVLPVLPPVAAEKRIEANPEHHEVQLDELILAAAKVYGYNDDDSRTIRNLAETDPDSLRLALLHDPLVILRLRARLGPGAPR